jgi:CRP/FNR family transcriptional regulator
MIDLAWPPTIRGLPLTGTGPVRPLLTAAQRRRLEAIATRYKVKPRTIIYRDGEPAEHIFINGGGVVIAYKDMANGKRRVAGFRFYADLFGLADHGRYVNTTRAVTEVIVHRIPVNALTEVLRQDAELEFQFLCKMVHEVRQAQRKLIMVARKDAAGRLVMFLDMLWHAGDRDASLGVIELPMSRSDIAGFLNLTLESISRATRQLSNEKILAFGRRRVRVLDRARFEQMLTSG